MVYDLIPNHSKLVRMMVMWETKWFDMVRMMVMWETKWFDMVRMMVMWETKWFDISFSIL